MAVHLFLAGCGLIGPVLLLRRARTGALSREQAIIIGVLCGTAGGAGIALGIRFQNTEANIHSGWSFASTFEWLKLAFVGGALGAAVGALLGRLALTWRPAPAVFVAFALVAAAGWAISAARPTIDCDIDEAFCSARYG